MEANFLDITLEYNPRLRPNPAVSSKSLLGKDSFLQRRSPNLSSLVNCTGAGRFPSLSVLLMKHIIRLALLAVARFLVRHHPH